LKISITILVLLAGIYGFAQKQDKRDSSHYQSLNLGIGYNYTYGESEDRNYHLIELGVNKTLYGGQHGGGIQYGVGTEIGLNTEKFIVGPKVSGIIYFQFIAFGAELITYTDFDNASLRFAPIFGLGNERVRLTFNPHLVLINDDFPPISGLVTLSVNLSLDKEERVKKR
jgi:hypothetical protein